MVAVVQRGGHRHIVTMEGRKKVVKLCMLLGGGGGWTGFKYALRLPFKTAIQSCLVASVTIGAFPCFSHIFSHGCSFSINVPSLFISKKMSFTFNKWSNAALTNVAGVPTVLLRY